MTPMIAWGWLGQIKDLEPQTGRCLSRERMDESYETLAEELRRLNVF